LIVSLSLSLSLSLLFAALTDELKKLSAAAKKGKKYKKDKPPELLDDGYFGKGIYFTSYSDYAYEN
jgi:hypothetical protein